VDIGTEIEVITVEPIKEPTPEREPAPVPVEQPAEPALVPANLLTFPLPGVEHVSDVDLKSWVKPG
jgi:hypothetical protein